MGTKILFYINGEAYHVSDDSAFLTLGRFLRQEGLKGCKLLCEEGDCGACSVLQAYPPQNDLEEAWPFHTINSCITSLFQLHGSHVVTVEGHANGQQESPLEGAMAEEGGSQCGYCSPGFMNSLAALFDETQQPTPKQVQNALTGNLCRCTGYRGILKAAARVAGCNWQPVKEKYMDANMYRELRAALKEDVLLSGAEREVLIPTTIERAFSYQKTHPNAKIWSGGTDLGVMMNKSAASCSFRHIIYAGHLSELKNIYYDNDALHIGAGHTIKEAERFFNEALPELGRYLRVFASPQIKHLGTLAGNIANASPIGDTMPPMLALDAKLNLISPRGSRLLPLSEFYLGYKEIALQQDEWIKEIVIPNPKKEALFRAYKVAKRKDLDISTVSGAFLLEMDQGKIVKARLAFGGVGPYPLRAKEAEEALLGQRPSQEVYLHISRILDDTIQPLSDHRGSQGYRKALVRNLTKRFFEEEVIQ